jgi:hypothetical protein
VGSGADDYIANPANCANDGDPLVLRRATRRAAAPEAASAKAAMTSWLVRHQMARSRSAGARDEGNEHPDRFEFAC